MAMSASGRGPTPFTSPTPARAKAAVWEEAFLDWYHFDWRVPVMGGRTLVETVLLSGSLSPQEKEMLEGWVGCHPSFYVVKGVEHGSGVSGGSDGSNGSGGSGGSPGSSRSGGGRPRPPIRLRWST